MKIQKNIDKFFTSENFEIKIEHDGWIRVKEKKESGLSMFSTMITDYLLFKGKKKLLELNKLIEEALLE